MSRLEAARRARLAKQRRQAQEHAITAVIWIAATLATFSTSYGVASWVVG